MKKLKRLFLKDYLQVILVRALVLYLLLFKSFGYSQIPNSSFEQWMTINTYENPIGWSTLNKIVASASLQSIVKLSPGNPGAYYLSAKTVSVSGKGLVPGRVVSGKIDTLNYRPLSGFPFTSRPAQLDYNMQYMVALPSDTAFVSVLLSKWNFTLQKRDTIGFGLSRFNGMAHQWFANSTLINYITGDNPDSALIVISSSSVAAMKDSYIYIDNLKFNGSVIGIHEFQPIKINLSATPNPFTDHITINIGRPSSEPTELFFYNAHGELHEYIEKIYGDPITFNTAGWPAGVYFIVLRTANINYATKKILK